MTELNLPRLLRAMAEPAATGALLPPLRAGARALEGATLLEQRLILSALDDLMSVCSERLTPAETAAALKILRAVRLRAAAEPQKTALDKRLRALARRRRPAHGPGVVNLLLTASRSFLGERYGVVHRLRVTTNPWGGQVVLENAQGDARLLKAFGAGVSAALSHVLRVPHGLGTLDGAILMHARTVRGALPEVAIPVGGNSLGLGAAVATLSALLEAPVPLNVGFTGGIDDEGRLLPVDGIAEKLAAARDRGLARVYVPGANAGQVRAVDRKARFVVACDTVAEVAEEVFPPAAMRNGLARLRALPLPADLRRRPWMTSKPSLAAATRVLLSAVGNNDPFGRPAASGDRAGKPEPGAVLTICRECRPHRVYLLHTDTKDTGQRFFQKAREMKRILGAEDPKCRVILVRVAGVSDPTDFSQLFPAFRAVASRVRRENPGDAAIMVNVTSGTPQMQLTWHLLVERGLLPDWRLQVPEGKHAKDSPTRVRRAELPVL